MEHDTVHDTEDVEKRINRKLTTFIAKNKQDREVIDETLIVMLLKR